MNRNVLVITFIGSLLILPEFASAMCADAASCRIFSAGMLFILCSPIYLIGLILLAIPDSRSALVVFGILGLLATIQAAYAVIPTRPDLLYYLPVHIIPTVQFLFFGIKSIRNRSKISVVDVQNKLLQ